MIPAITIDGFQVEIGANVGSVPDAMTAFKNGAEGIGVFRTELIYMKGDALPTENEQYEIYKEVNTLAANRPVIIRTLDIGGDKHPDYLAFPIEGIRF